MKEQNGARHQAAALGYDTEKDKAPKVVAKGAGYVADKIVQIAREHNVPVKEDPDLVQALTKLDLYQEIPEELYRVAAEMLAEVYLINKKMK